MNERITKLTQAYNNGDITADELAALEDALRSDANVREQLLHEMNVRAALEDLAMSEDIDLAMSDGVARSSLTTSNDGSSPKRRWQQSAGWLVAASVAIVATLFSINRPSEIPIARVTGAGGPLQWIGDEGRVFEDLKIGAELSGGTIDASSPDAWFELEFNDGSTVMISGDSILTFSDHGQKNLHLRGGRFTADVEPQPAGKPMLIHTRSAVLEVLGTQFEVDAGLAETVLDVSEGKVRVRRVSDGSTVDVPANHRVIAAADQALAPTRSLDSVSGWKSQIDRRPEYCHGAWSPSDDGKPAELRTIPYTIPTGRTIYTASLGVSTGDSPTVILAPETRIRVRGTIERPHDIYCGLSVRNENGEFAGRFQIIAPAASVDPDQPFDITFDLADFTLDPSIAHLKERLAKQPSGVAIDYVWCHTLFDQVGLSLTSIELLPAEPESIARSSVATLSLSPSILPGTN